MDFQTRAKLADAAVWAVLRNQIGTLTEPADVEAVMSGAVAALTRLVWNVTEAPTVTQTVEVIREMACGSAVAVQAEAEAIRTARETSGG
jgi:hypothetical protein